MSDADHRRQVGDRTVVDVAGAAEATGLTRGTIEVYSTPKGRAATGFPEVAEKIGRTKWFYLDEVLAWRENDAGTAAGDEDLIGLAELAELRNLSHSTAVDLATKSVPHWREGRDSWLPRPLPEYIDLTAEQFREGRRWHRSAALRPAITAPKGRPAGPRPTTNDLADVLAASPPPRTLAAVAAALEAGGYAPVNTTTAKRLLRQLREQVLKDLVTKHPGAGPDLLLRELEAAVPFPLNAVAWKSLATQARLDPQDS